LIGLYEVGFGDFVSWLGEALGKIAVVSQNDEACGGTIEPACEMQLPYPRLMNDIDDGEMLWIAGCREDTARLVKHQVTRNFRLHCLSRYGDVIKFPDQHGAIIYHGVIEQNFTALQDALGVALALAAAFGDEVDEAHGEENYSFGDLRSAFF
jgi:hypothetical protein